MIQPTSEKFILGNFSSHAVKAEIETARSLTPFATLTISGAGGSFAILSITKIDLNNLIIALGDVAQLLGTRQKPEEK